MSVKLFFFLCLLHLTLALSEIPIAKLGCNSQCGNISIPYPFGIGKDCFIDSWAEVECVPISKHSKLFLKDDRELEIVRLSTTEVYLKNNVSSVCYDNFGNKNVENVGWILLYFTPFFLSPKNIFFVTGCGMLGSFNLVGFRDYSSGCANFCANGYSDQGQSEGQCHLPIPPDLVGVKEFSSYIQAINTSVYNTSNCGYSFFADENYSFKASEIDSFTQPTIGLNFVVGNQTCEDARRNTSSFACNKKSDCIYSEINSGYTCSCHKGYEGNPYLPQGCKDINECQHPNNNTCIGKCFNTQGSYHCFPLLAMIIIGFILALLLLLGTGLGIYGRKRAQLSKLREKYFEQNGGLLLQEKISMHVGGAESTKIFTAKELKLATNNYEESRVLGEGGFGKVYKGVLPDLRVVAIKKSKMIDKDQLEQFINEVDILTQINHRNIVKLLGCCLEIELPLLVYEFVSNGTLSEHISKKYDFLHWEDRLRIAAEIASALAYLHYSASIPIIHRDVKSANILLDEDLTAKVADFGASRVNPLDETQISTLVKGTLGYLDPEYMLTNQLTQKSDVYSFGVVLAELLTGEKPLSFQRPQVEKSLAMHFTRAMNENQLLHILQDGIAKDENINQVYAVAELARNCLRISGEERPSMREVVAELEGLRGFDKKRLSSRKGNEERVNVTSKQVERQESTSYNGNTGNIFEYTGVEMVMPLKDAR